MRQYLNFLEKILAEGIHKSDRTGTGTISCFGLDMRFDLQQGFPLVTTKKVHTRSIIHELLWFISGDTNIRYLQDNNVKIWNEWADEDGDLGPVYGQQWRSWGCADGRKIDQLQQLITNIRKNPDSRRLILNAWNVGELDKMALPPCHAFVQFYVANGYLSCKLTQRSADAFLGVPFNIASYSLLTHMIAQQCDLLPGEFVWSGGDCHIYSNHVDQVKTQINRKPYLLPQLKILRRPIDINDYCFEDFQIVNYQCHEKITAPISV